MSNLTQSITFSTLILIISFVLLVFLTFKGIGKVFAPLLCTALLALASTTGFVNALFTVFPAGVASFLNRIMLPSITGTLFGEAMAHSGAGHTIGQTITKVIGKDNAPYVVMLTTVLVALSGMTMAVFTIAALSFSVMKEANLPNYIGLVAYFAVSDITIFCLPGVPHNVNLLPTTYLGTDLYAGFWPGLIGTLCAYALAVLYIRFLVKRARANNIGYTPSPFDRGDINKNNDDRKYPSFAKSIIPLFIVIVVTFILQKGLNLNSTLAVFVGQILAFLVMWATCHDTFDESMKDIFVTSAEAVGSFLFTCGCMVGYASVVSQTLSFKSLISMLDKMSINPYVFTVIAVALIAGMSAEAVTGEILFLESFSAKLLANPAVNAGIIHRLTTMTATAFDSMPHGGMVLLTLDLFGLDHKHGYKYVFMAAIFMPLVATMVAMGISVVFY